MRSLERAVKDVRRLYLTGLLPIVGAVALVGCGDNTNAGPVEQSTGSPQTAATTTQQSPTVSTVQPAPTPTVESPEETAGGLLDRWTGKWVPLVLLLRERSQAAQAGDLATDQRLTTQIRAKLQAVEHWGRDARAALVDVPPGALKTAMVAAGDAWSQWALLLDTDQAIDYTQGARIADAFAEAIRQMRTAYRLSGRSIPPELQTSAGGG